MYSIGWKGSPHFTPNVRPQSGPITPHPLIVLHTMAGSLAGTLAHFQNPDTQVSSHYGVGRKGEIYQYVICACKRWGVDKRESPETFIKTNHSAKWQSQPLFHHDRI